VVGGGVVEVVVGGDVAGRGELCRVLAPWLLGLGVTRPVDVVDEHALAVSSTAAAARQARRRISTSFPSPRARLGPDMLTRAGSAVLHRSAVALASPATR
jgi:hypothetical protein